MKRSLRENLGILCRFRVLKKNLLTTTTYANIAVRPAPEDFRVVYSMPSSYVRALRSHQPSIDPQDSPMASTPLSRSSQPILMSQSLSSFTTPLPTVPSIGRSSQPILMSQSLSSFTTPLPTVPSIGNFLQPRLLSQTLMSTMDVLPTASKASFVSHSSESVLTPATPAISTSDVPMSDTAWKHALNVAISGFNYNYHKYDRLHQQDYEHYLDHASALITHIEECQFEPTEPLVQLLCMLGSYYLNERRWYKQALQYYERATRLSVEDTTLSFKASQCIAQLYVIICTQLANIQSSYKANVHENNTVEGYCTTQRE